MVVEEVVFDVRDDASSPDLFDDRFVEDGSHEMARPDRQVLVAEHVVRCVDHVCNPCEGWVMILKEVAKRGVDWWLGREEGVEVEASPQRSIDQCDGSVCSIHGADDGQIPRDREFCVRVLESCGGVSVFEKKEEFTEHFGQIRSIDLIDDHDVRLVRIVSRLISE